MSSEQNTNEASSALNLRRARTIGQSLLGTQVRKQATLLGDSIGEFGDTLSEVALEFEQRGKGAWVAPACDYVATRVNSVAGYLRSGSNEDFVRDFGAFAGRQPAVVGAAALASGFALARILRLAIEETTGGSSYGGNVERP